MTPLYRCLVEQALIEAGVLEPTLTTTGEFLDGDAPLLDAEDGPALAIQAVAMADAATGAAFGRELSDALAHALGQPRLNVQYERIRSGEHDFSNSWWADAPLHDAARAVAAQHSSEEG
jgi:hypothetical protein